MRARARVYARVCQGNSQGAINLRAKVHRTVLARALRHTENLDFIAPRQRAATVISFPFLRRTLSFVALTRLLFFFRRNHPIETAAIVVGFIKKCDKNED